jgi:signal-transduction protein with cAMP-binding, CBS, and nucleotidyltransferase domain
MNDTIAALMTREILTIGMDDSVAQVEAALVDRGLSWAPVLEPGGAVVGVISSADLLQFHAQQRDPRSVRAWQLCTYKPISVDQTTPIGDVARTMLEQRIHHVVVTDGARPVGVVSSLDFVRAYVERN